MRFIAVCSQSLRNEEGRSCEQTLFTEEACAIECRPSRVLLCTPDTVNIL